MSNQSLLLTLPGEYAVHPLVTIRPTAIRPSPTAAFGWRYRRRYRVLNTSDERLTHFDYALDLGPTNGLVSGGKAKADGSDLRVWRNGVEIARNLNTWNGSGAVGSTTSTLVWVTIDELAPGQYQDYEVVYGNPSAGAAPTLSSGVDAPIFNIATTGASRASNTFWPYAQSRVAANAGLGLWWLSSGVAQPDTQMIAPGSWQAANTKHSVDASRQLAYETFDDGGVKYLATLSARRGRAGAQVGQEGMGGDGVQIHHPGGIVSVRADFLFTNPAINTSSADPVGKLVILGRRLPMGEWLTIAEDATRHDTETTIAAATYSMPGAAARDVALAVWPFDDEVTNPAARGDVYAELRVNSVVELNVTSPASQTLQQGETEIVEAGWVAQVGGGGSAPAVAPFRYVGVGDWSGSSGVGTRRTSLKADGSEKLVIDNEKRTVQVLDNTSGAKLEDVPYAAFDAFDAILQDGVTVEMAAAQWLALRPVTNPLSNPSAETDALDWTSDTAAGEDTGMTVGAIARTTSTPDSGAGAFTRSITASTAAAGKLHRSIADDYLPIGELQAVQVGAAVRTANINLRPLLYVAFYDANLALLSRSTQAEADGGVAAINTWERHAYAALVPSGAAYWRSGVAVKDLTGSQTGAVGWDTVAPDGPEVIIRDVAAGPKQVTIAAAARYA